MRVLYFTRDYTPHDFRFLSALNESDHEVFLLRLEDQGRNLESRPLPDNISVIDWIGGKSPFDWQKFPEYMQDLQRVIREFKPDVVHAGPVYLCAYMTALIGFEPLVSMSWGSDLLREIDMDCSLHWMAQLALQRTKILIGDCQAVADKASSEFDFNQENVVLFPWGIEPEKFVPGRNDEFRQKMGWQDKTVVLSLRSWEPIYGVTDMLRGFGQAQAEDDSLRLILLGNGSMKDEVQALIRQFDMQEKIFPGGQVSQNELPHMYQAADLYLSASYSDGSSVSLLEAMASGLPALVSDIPGNREWVTENETGKYFPAGNAEMIAEKLLALSNMPMDLRKMGQNARKVAEERADWSKNISRLFDAYERAVA